MKKSTKVSLNALQLKGYLNDLKCYQIGYVLVVVVLPDPFRGMGGVEELHGDSTVGPRSKVCTRGQKRRSIRCLLLL